MGSAPKEVKELVDRFAGNIEEYKQQGYNEAGVRKEFIDPFFEALGWDVTNKQEHAVWDTSQKGSKLRLT